MARKVAAQGIEMLPADRWESQHNLAFQLYLGIYHPLSSILVANTRPLTD